MPAPKGAEASIVGGGVENNRMGAGDRGWLLELFEASDILV